jgi:L-2-hydroxyglutarate oxidase LhgO
MTYDLAIIGGGIVGLATTLSLLQQHPNLKAIVVEKEAQVAAHQTGHNSGVIHSGIYYKPGSLKAQLCVSGARKMEAFCEENNIPYNLIGKVIVATSPDELPRLQMLYERAKANGVPGVIEIAPEQLREIEPHATGLKGLHSPRTGIVDYKDVCNTLRRIIEQQGVTVRTGAKVVGITQSSNEVTMQTTQGDIAARYVVNCAGLYSDVVARMMGQASDVRIVPFRGEYYMLQPAKHHLVKGLIYPVPDPRFPFLGVHFTRTIHGEVEAGPNAVFAFAREGYTLGKIHASELMGALAYRGFWIMAAKYWRMALGEYYRSFSKAAFVRSMQRLIPDIQSDDVARGGAGVRAQALSATGELVDDFRIVETARALHVLNAPSPAATASLAIGEYIAARVKVNSEQ